MSNNAITPQQALQVLRELANHPQLRFLNLAEHSAVQQSLEALAPLVAPVQKELTLAPDLTTV